MKAFVRAVVVGPYWCQKGAVFVARPSMLTLVFLTKADVVAGRLEAEMV